MDHNELNHFEAPFDVTFSKEDLYVLSKLNQDQLRSWISYFLTHQSVAWDDGHKKQIYDKEALEFGRFFLDLLESSADETMKSNVPNLRMLFHESNETAQKAYKEKLATLYSPWLIAYYIALSCGDVIDCPDQEDAYCGAFDAGIESLAFLKCCLRLSDCLALFELRSKN